MVVEYIRYTVPVGQAQGFERAYAQAGHVLDADPHCLRWEVTRGVEEPEHFVVRIEWDSIEGHEQGFRTSAGFREFFAAVRREWGFVINQESSTGTGLSGQLDGASLERNARRAERVMAEAGLALGLSDRTTMVGERAARRPV